MSAAFVTAVSGGAHADTAPVSPGEPLTAAADRLPTVQVNGVVWDQAIVGNMVYAVGEFTRARPAGSALGVNEVARTNMLAYDLTTGALIPGFNATFNAAVNTVAASADGSRIYVGGAFTTVNGVNRYRLAALNPATGALITSFAPTPNASVKSLAVTSTGVYFGGFFSNVSGMGRTKAAAVSPSGAVLPWRPSVPNGTVQALTVSPDGTRVVIGGSFTSVNGSSNPGYGLALLDSTNGTSNLPMQVNTLVRNGGTQSAILALKGDADGFYGSGYHFGGGGNLEGSFGATWGGAMTWVEDCHGDTYDIAPQGQVVYSASHKHYCGNLGTGGFPQTDPWTFQRATATTKYATGLSKRDPFGYPDHLGQPSPTLLTFYPDINTGTYTGKSQGPWTVEANSSYVLYGGEFTRVNGTLQQGLVRFARKEIAPNKMGPVLAGSTMNPTLTSAGNNAVRVAWKGNWDRDNGTLTYRVQRGGVTVYETSRTAPFWQIPNLTWTESGLVGGSTAQYRIQAVDAFGNVVTSDTVSTTVAGTGGGGGGTTAASDSFSRTVSGGWGAAQTGGSWTVTGGSSSFSVNGSKGLISLPSAGASRTAVLGSVSSSSSDTTAEISMDKVATGGGTYAAVIGRSVDASNQYRARLILRATGDVQLQLSRVVAGTETSLATTTLAGVPHVAGATYKVRLQVDGTGSTALRAKAWKTSASEPSAWMVQTSDSSGGLQVKGAVGIWTYVSGSATNTPQTVSVDNVSVTSVG